MGTSRALAAPGVRTAPVSVGWRADLATISSTVGAHAAILVPGVIGFALRGGIILLTVPVLILPTSVEVRLLLGSNIGSTGLTGAFYLLIAALSGLTLLLALGVLVVLARCELASYNRFVNARADRADHAWDPPGQPEPSEKSHVITRLFVVESVALLAVLLAAVPFAAAISQATINEITLPSSTDSIYMRIAQDVALPFVAWLVAIVVIEAGSALWARRVLAKSFGLSDQGHIGSHPLRVVAVALLGWALFIGAVGASILVLAVAWDIVRSVFLSTGLSGDVRDIVSALLVALLLGVAFAAALLLCGLVSTIRGGLWTLASLR